MISDHEYETQRTGKATGLASARIKLFHEHVYNN